MKSFVFVFIVIPLKYQFYSRSKCLLCNFKIVDYCAGKSVQSAGRKCIVRKNIVSVWMSSVECTKSIPVDSDQCGGLIPAILLWIIEFFCLVKIIY
jgi:hypothetical protein